MLNKKAKYSKTIELFVKRQQFDKLYFEIMQNIRCERYSGDEDLIRRLTYSALPRAISEETIRELHKKLGGY